VVAYTLSYQIYRLGLKMEKEKLQVKLVDNKYSK
jgi:hypothetical protein